MSQYRYLAMIPGILLELFDIGCNSFWMTGAAVASVTTCVKNQMHRGPRVRERMSGIYSGLVYAFL